MTTDPAYRAYVTTGRITRPNDSIKSVHTVDDMVILRVLLQPSERWDEEFAVELSFGRDETVGGVARCSESGRLCLISALQDKWDRNHYPYKFPTPAIAIKRDFIAPERLTSVDTDSEHFQDLHVTIDEYKTPTSDTSPIQISLSDNPQHGAELELTSAQRNDLAQFLTYASVTPYLHRPEAATLVGPDGRTTDVTTGVLHKNSFSPYSHLDEIAHQQTTLDTL